MALLTMLSPISGQAETTIVDPLAAALEAALSGVSSERQISEQNDLEAAILDRNAKRRILLQEELLLTASTLSTVERFTAGTWTVFTAGLECWAVSVPTSSENTRDGKLVSVKRSGIFLFFGGDWPILFTGGYPLAPDKEVSATIGSKSFVLEERDVEWAGSNTFFPKRSQAEIRSAFQKGQSVTITAQSNRGTVTKDTFSLLGFASAISEATRQCEMKTLLNDDQENEIGLVSCSADPNECTPKKLCEVATNQEGGNTSWSTASSKAKHVKFAQGLGMTCGVTAALDPCDSDPNECKISQLCEKATSESAGKKSWDTSAEAYLTLAKEYGLQCDVAVEPDAVRVITNFKQAFKSEPKLKRQQLQYALKELGYYSYGADGLWGKGTSSAFDKFVSGYVLESDSEAAVFRSLLSKVTVPSSFSAKETCSASQPGKCSETEVCNAAWRGGQWTNLKVLRPYIAEAKKRGLTCGTDGTTNSAKKTCSASQPGECSETEVCNAAWRGGQWTNLKVLRPYIAEAKKRGLTCGTDDKTNSAKKTCSASQPGECSETEVCNAALGGGQWTNLKILLPYVAEAKKRGLTCEFNSQTNSSLLTCKGSHNATRWTDCFGTHTAANGGKYVGEWKDGKYNGNGIFTRPDGSKYVGKWKGNIPEGRGTITFPDGNKLVGEFKNAKPTGEVVVVLSNGDTIYGQVKDDEIYGQSATYANGDRYVGEFRDEIIRHGQGSADLC